jgi:tetratricopeptide (TPR) repeat protein
MPSNRDQSRVLIRAESDKYSDKALEFERLGQFENALAAYELALTVDPTHAAVWSNKGTFLADRQRWEESLDCYDWATDFAPENVLYWWNKAITLQDVNRPAESLVSWRRVVAIDPNRSGHGGESDIAFSTSKDTKRRLRHLILN